MIKRKWVLPILLICNLIIFLKNYIGTGDVNLTQLCVIFGLTPIAVKDTIKISNDKKYTYFSALMFALAASMLLLKSIQYM